MYKWISLNQVILNIDDNSTITIDPKNMDWQKFQLWLAAGNVPLPQDGPTADQIRLLSVDSSISSASYGTVQPATVLQLKAMDNVAFDTWFGANITTSAQAIGLLKLLTRIIVRRLL